jgi:hypothetical protein
MSGLFHVRLHVGIAAIHERQCRAIVGQARSGLDAWVHSAILCVRPQCASAATKWLWPVEHRITYDLRLQMCCLPCAGSAASKAMAGFVAPSVKKSRIPALAYRNCARCVVCAASRCSKHMAGKYGGPQFKKAPSHNCCAYEAALLWVCNIGA